MAGSAVGTAILGAGPGVQGAPRRVLQQLGSMRGLEGYRGSSRGAAEPKSQRSSGVGGAGQCGRDSRGRDREGTAGRKGGGGRGGSQSSDVIPAPAPHRWLHVLAAGGGASAGTSGMGRGRRPAAHPIGCGAQATSLFKTPPGGRGRHCSSRHRGPRAPVVSRGPPPATDHPRGPSGAAAGGQTAAPRQPDRSGVVYPPGGCRTGAPCAGPGRSDP